MTFESEDLAKLQKAAITGESLESTGIPITPELVSAFEVLVSQVAAAPKGSMAEIVEDLEWGKWDAFEANNERFYGPLYVSETAADQSAKKRKS
jgi:hypothetical protein